MLQTKFYKIDSTDDVELGIKRSSKLEFKVVFEDSKSAKAIFVFITGCGMDAVNGDYPQHIAEFVAQSYGAAVLLVNYHCIQNRYWMGATNCFDEIDFTILSQSCEALNIALPANLVPKVNETAEFSAIIELLRFLNIELRRLKNERKFLAQNKLILTLSTVPTKNEYQNFGVMQALDILNALCFVKKSAEFKLAKDCKSLLLGSSHGGYLALLCAKFAPWLIDGVVENSSYVSVPPQYIGFGKQLDYEKYYEMHENLENILLKGFTKSLWSIDRASPHFFSPAHNRIRNILDGAHLQVAAGHFKPKIISYHGINDTIIAPVKQKCDLHELLAALGFENRLFVAKSKDDIDGKFIKHLEHGMGMSLKTLIKRELPPLLEAKFARKKDEPREISYESEDLCYHFKENSRGGGIDLVIERGENV